jgi:hypothetical protein
MAKTAQLSEIEFPAIELWISGWRLALFKPRIGD